jgi:CCR4-NOT transcription complex subunit 7/8
MGTMQPGPEGLTGLTANGDVLRVREVWADNLEQEFELMRNVVEQFPFVAMDTEFPGVVARCVRRKRPSRAKVSQERCGPGGRCMAMLHRAYPTRPPAGAALVLLRPVGNFKSSREYHYKALKMNVDMLKVIQLGLTFTDDQGQLPRCNGELCVWQFNFKGFRLADDVYAQDSIELLKQSGIDFDRNEARGIDVQRFGELLMSSGVVLNDDIKWITFHSG